MNHHDDSEKSVIESMQATAARLNEVRLIRIDGSGLTPALEAFMAQILMDIRSKIQVPD